MDNIRLIHFSGLSDPDKCLEIDRITDFIPYGNDFEFYKNQKIEIEFIKIKKKIIKSKN